jgi:hypothetical protein
MKTENLDRILGTEEELVPSSGFVASVMERVREEAAAPAPIPFPWKRIVPAMLLALGVLGWSVAELVRNGLSDLRSLALVQPHVSTALTQSVQETGWVAMALGVSLAAWVISRRLVGRSGLL